MLVAGDDAGRKPRVMELIAKLGFEAVDANPLKNVRLLEARPRTRLYLRAGEHEVIRAISAIARVDNREKDFRFEYHELLPKSTKLNCPVSVFAVSRENMRRLSKDLGLPLEEC
jgi:hypothetical protein